MKENQKFKDLNVGSCQIHSFNTISKGVFYILYKLTSRAKENMVTLIYEIYPEYISVFYEK